MLTKVCELKDMKNNKYIYEKYQFDFEKRINFFAESAFCT